MAKILTPTMISPSSGEIGLPTGLKEAGQRVDLKPDKLTLMIETKGYRLAWSRGAPCPCAPLNDQTEQTNPNCPLCEGSGWLYFAPSQPITEKAGTFTDLQQAVIARFKAGVIRGIMTMGKSDDAPYDKLSYWRDGEMQLTVRPENKIAYYDRLINLDSEMTFYEIRDAKSLDTPYLTPRYHAITVNMLRSETVVYEPGVDFGLEDGRILWLRNQPPEGTQLLIHYQTFPVWLVQSYPHVVRGTLVKYKKAETQTPQGDHYRLPIQAVVKYEFLVGDAGKTGTSIE